jgi:PTH1 family peptidyl-tRNA hydrolase
VWIVAGLGNPGPEYAGTRHNVGFLVAEVLAARDPRAPWERRGLALATTAHLKDQDLLLLRPQTYMNRSGLAIASTLAELATPPERLVVIHDEVDLPFGTLRLKAGGGHGGHNGLRSITAELNAQNFLRVRVGIGRPAPGVELTDWVLGPWDPDQREELPGVLDRAAEATLALITEGLTAAANRFNVRPARTEAGAAPDPAGPTQTRTVLAAEGEAPGGSGPRGGDDQAST